MRNASSPGQRDAAGPDREQRHWLAGTLVDRVLLVLAVAASLAGWFVVQGSLGQGVAMARIYHGETLLAEYPLHGNGGDPIHVHAKGDLGESHIIIEEGGVHFASSPCTSRQCVRSGTVHDAGRILACVPNRIFVSLDAKSDDGSFDAVAE